MAQSTEIYLEGFKPSHSQRKFEPLPKPGDITSTQFAKKTGPGSSEGFRENGTIGDDPNKNKGKALPEPPKLSQGTEKTDGKKLNNSRRTKLMSEKKNTTPKSEFDKLCESVLGPDEVELGIEETPNAHEEGGETPGEEAAECGPCERIRSIITELEGILAEMEGTGTEEGDALAGEHEEPVEGAGSAASPEVTREAVEAEELGTPITGMKTGKPDAVKGRANVVDGKASKVTKGPGDGKIDGKRTGELEKAPDGVAIMDGKPTVSNIHVKSKITGKNQELFH